jgi:hypothetical protein
MLAGSIENGKLSNSSFFIGTTSISLGRGSASQTLNGVAIDGNAGSVTNGVYTTGDQTIGGTKTFSSTIVGSINGNAATSTSTSNIGGATWAPTTNILLGQSANGQEWSFDITRNGFTGGYWHVWDSANSTMLKVDAVSGKVSAPYNFVGNLEGNITGTASNITAYTINQSVGTGNLPTFAGVKGSSYFDAQASSGFRIRNSNDTANTGALTRRGLWEGNSNYDPGLWAETGYGLYFYSNGSANIRAYFDTSGHLLPGANNTYNLGSASLGWANIYTNDLHLSNMNKPEGNDIDGTKGTWTIQEGAENLYIINNNNGKKFKISLEEI